VSCLVTLARCWQGCTFSEGPRLRKMNPPRIERIERIERVRYVLCSLCVSGGILVPVLFNEMSHILGVGLVVHFSLEDVAKINTP
jgi:hypothetical protein